MIFKIDYCLYLFLKVVVIFHPLWDAVFLFFCSNSYYYLMFSAFSRWLIVFKSNIWCLSVGLYPKLEIKYPISKVLRLSRIYFWYSDGKNLFLEKYRALFTKIELIITIYLNDLKWRTYSPFQSFVELFYCQVCPFPTYHVRRAQRRRCPISFQTV